MPYPDAHFDAVYGSSVLHHLDLDAALREAFRVLKPGGRLVFAEPNILNPQVVVMFQFECGQGAASASPPTRWPSRASAPGAPSSPPASRASPSSRSTSSIRARRPAWIDRVARLGRGLERTPLLREIAGSLLLTARKP